MSADEPPACTHHHAPCTTTHQHAAHAAPDMPQLHRPANQSINQLMVMVARTNHVKLLIFVDFCVFLGVLALG